jgi:hypothetical protein
MQALTLFAISICPMHWPASPSLLPRPSCDLSLKIGSSLGTQASS